MKRTTSFGLGLAGGIVAVLVGLRDLFAGLFLKTFDFSGLGKFSDFLDKFGGGEAFFNFGKNLSFFLLPASIIMIAAGVLGIIGASTIKKNIKTAGILMLVGAGMCFIVDFNIIVIGLLTAAGVLALIEAKQNNPKPEE